MSIHLAAISPLSLTNTEHQEASPFVRLADEAVPEGRARFLFPKPSGDFRVGIQSYILRDKDCTVAISVHYPTQHQNSFFRRQPLEPYFGDLTDLGCKPEPERYANYSSYAQPDVPPAGGSFPVIIMAHGMGGHSDECQPIVEELTSRGFCVVAMESPGVAGYSRVLASQSKPALVSDEVLLRTAPREAMEMQVADAHVVLKALPHINPDLAGVMDLQNIGMMGHSLGGAAAAQVCRKVSQVKAGINLDGRLLGDRSTDPISQPFLTILSDRRAATLGVLTLHLQAVTDHLKQAEELRQDGKIKEATELEETAVSLLEETTQGAKDCLDPILECDQFTGKAGEGSYRVTLKGSQHIGFTARRLLCQVIGLKEAAEKSNHFRKEMYQEWEKQIPADVATWTAASQHAVSFFSTHLRGKI